MATRVRSVSKAAAATATASAIATGQFAASVQDLTKRFGSRTVLDGLGLDIKAGEFVAMIGRSGSGKSTLLRALAGLDRDVSGSMAVAEPVAVAFQEPRLVPWKRVLDNLTLGLRVPEPTRVATEALADAGLLVGPTATRLAAPGQAAIDLAWPAPLAVARRAAMHPEPARPLYLRAPDARPKSA